MFIKQVIIEGFKSYRERTVLKPFDPNLNIIVGANGSGKSNILYAIQFVLSEELSHLKNHMRQSLLCHDSRHRITTASVEIIFDNTKKQLPVSSDLVSFSRRVGLKYDQFYINKKNTSHKEMVDILVSAGFCTCNTYHIVKQGKVNQMATSPDSYRLSVLLEVAGTQVHEDEIQRTKIALEEIDQKVKYVKSLMQTMSKRLQVLAQEKKDIEEFTNLNEARRVLDYCLYQSQLKALEEELQTIEESYSPTLKNQREGRTFQQNAHKEVLQTRILLEGIESRLRGFQDSQSKLRVDEQQVQGHINEINLKIKTLTDEHLAVSEQKAQTQDKLKALEEQITEHERKLLELEPKYNESKTREEECSKTLSELKQKRNEIYDKLGRSEQFDTKEERDAYLQNEIESVSKTLEEIQLKEDKIVEELQKNGEQEMKLNNKIEELKKVEDLHQNNIATQEKNLYDIEKKRVEGETMLSELFRREADVAQKQSSLLDDFTKARQSLCSVTDKNGIDGLEGLQRVMKELQENEAMANIVSGYCGTVLDNLECSESLFTAVEVTAAKRLFYHIVATDEVSSKITKVFNQRDMQGEINFLLLNHLSVKDHYYPDSNDTMPLIHKLQYEPEYDKAMQYVFGKTLLSRNMKVAFDFVEKNNLDCVTLDGDQVLRSGSLCGGYRDKSKSVILAYRNYTSLQKLLKEGEEEIQKTKDEIKYLRDEMTKYANKKQILERKIINTKNVIEHVKSSKILLTDDLGGMKEVGVKKRKSLNQCRSNLEMLQAHKIALQDELNHQMVSELSESEQRDVDQLNEDIRRLTEECKRLLFERFQLEYDGELLLKHTLKKQHENLLETLESLKEESISRSIKLTKLVLDSTSEEFNVIQEKLRDTEKSIEETKKEQKSFQDKLKNQKAEEANIQPEIDKYDKEIQLFTTKKGFYKERIQECKEKINKLGTLSVQEEIKYKNMETKQAMKMLREVNKKLKKFQKVNMQTTTVNYAKLLERDKDAKSKLKKIEEGYNHILSLLDMMEIQKNDAILLTFRQSSDYFSTIFKKLVPNGHAKLIMKTSEGESVPIQDVTDVSTIKGIGILVSFHTDSIEEQELKQTSGGEKSVLALTLIFALQKCSPAPFCVIDEMDSMLDSAYRPALAQMISELSEKTQFIVTTHGPDILDYGDQFYLVKNINQVSRVKRITKQEALEFVA